MGMANLVPGVSGGTMIVVMGLYEEFISSIADVTRFKFTKRNIVFLGIVGLVAVAAIAALAGTLSRAVTLHRGAMFSLFIGLTLGGTSVLFRMLDKINAASVVGAIVGLALIVGIALTNEEPPDREAVRAAVARGTFVISPYYSRDVIAGVLGMAAMVLPGISGAYMFLILGRYEAILASISLAKTYVFSFGGEGDPLVFLRVVIPAAVGALLGLVVLSNFLKWMLHRHRHATVGLLLGILFGSVAGIWPFDRTSSPADFAIGAALAMAGFITTVFLSRIRA
jgi:putative membrane protein